MKLYKVGCFFLLMASMAFSADNQIHQSVHESCPQWMEEQINNDLAPWRDRAISLEELDKRFQEFQPDHHIFKISIKNNRIYTEKKSKEPGVEYRLKGFTDALRDLSRIHILPDVTFYITIHDGVMQPNYFAQHLIDFPIFTMSRATIDPENVQSILVPDYEGLYENYQVLEKKDIVKYEIPWQRKLPVMVWRGSTAQCAYDLSDFPHISASSMNENNAHKFTRFLLCQLSKDNPSLINARYTYLADLDNTFPYIKTFQGKWLTYEEEYRYKYLILINGNAASYTNSGWKFFTNSVVFLPKSMWTQWYYGALKPYVHYIPVAEDLGDLVEKINWARLHDAECELIANNARNFAISYLTRPDLLNYWYFLLLKYSELSFLN